VSFIDSESLTPRLNVNGVYQGTVTNIAAVTNADGTVIIARGILNIESGELGWLDGVNELHAVTLKTDYGRKLVAKQAKLVRATFGENAQKGCAFWHARFEVVADG